MRLPRDVSWTLTPPWRWIEWDYDSATGTFREVPDDRPYWRTDRISFEERGVLYWYLRVAGLEVSGVLD